MKLLLACANAICATFVLTDNGRIVKSIELSFIGNDSRQNEINRNLFSRLFFLTTLDSVAENDILWEENDAAEDVDTLSGITLSDEEWEAENAYWEAEEDYYRSTADDKVCVGSIDALEALKRQLEERA